MIADPRLTAQQRALAQGLLGDVLDAQGRVSEAFAASTACKSGLARVYAASHGAGTGELAFAREMIDVLDRVNPNAWRSRGAPAAGAVKTHVFLLGFPRSGTTLLEQILASHHDVEALEERDTLIDAARTFMSEPRSVMWLATADETELARLRAAYWSRVRAEGAKLDRRVFIDKHPLNVFKLPLIAKLFPEARILFARRDPRDVVLSCYRRNFAMSGSAYQFLTLAGAAGYYDAAMCLAQRFEPVLAARTRVIRHELLVQDFDGVIGEVCRVLGIDWTPALRGFSERTKDRGIAAPSGAQLAGGLSAEGIGQWRRYRDQLAPVLPILAPWVERFSYDAD